MIDVECPKCGAEFQVRDSLAGGVANCQGCRALVEIPGTHLLDNLLHVGIGLGGLVVVCVGAGLIVAGQSLAGIVVIGVGIIVGSLIYLCS